MKILKHIFFISLLIVNVFSMSIKANESSLTIHYTYEYQNIEGVNVETYFIADYVNGTYELTENFKDYSIDFSNISNQNDWKEIANTLASYIVADNLIADNMGTTNENGQVTYNQLKPGLYLTLSNDIQKDDKIITFETFLTVLQTESLTVKPKYTSYTTENKPLEYKIIKQWKDKNHINERVNTVDVDIYKDKELYKSVQLNTENNWTYQWNDSNGSKWNIVERNIDGKYDVLIYQDQQVFIITNTYRNPNEKTPLTGDSSNVTFYIIAMSICGLLMIIIALFLRKKDHD